MQVQVFLWITVGQQLLLDYQNLVHQLEEARAAHLQLDLQVEQLLEESIILTEQPSW